MKYLLDSTLLIQGVRVSVSLGVSDGDYCALINDHNKQRDILRDLAHDLLGWRWKENKDATVTT